MNIHVVRSDGSWYARPDVTLVRDADRFCLPDDCICAFGCRARCIRIAKSGKAVEAPFARRYFDGWADSILFYGLTAEGFLTPWLDRSTWVSRTFHDPDTLDEETLQRVVSVLCRISRHLSLRIGDFLIFECPPVTELRRGAFFDNIAIL